MIAMYLGIEIGGTKLQLGVGPGDGTLAARWRGHVDAQQGAEGILQRIAEVVPSLLAHFKIPYGQLRGVGVGFGGPFDDNYGRVIKSHQIAGWDLFPLAEWMERQFELPAVCGNDADVAGLAEALFGMGQKLSSIFYITIGSGIGGGFVVNGQIYRGAGRGAAEIGHLQVVDGNGRVPLEQIASGWSIGAFARQMAAKNSARAAKLIQVAGKAEAITAEHVAQAAEQGDVLALGILQRAWSTLAEGICQMVTLLCPERIVIGGGVSLMGEQLFFEPLRRLVAQRVFAPFSGCFDIVPASLGEDVVVHGALGLARQRFGDGKPVMLQT